MTSAFAYLTWCTVRNRVRVRLRRLREPRYLIGAIIGGLYFWLMFFRPRTPRTDGAAPGLISMFERFRGTAVLAGSVALFVVTAVAWLVPSSGGGIGFTNSEVQFLFPAPVTRAELIRFRLIRSQLGVLLGSALMTIFFRPSTLAHGWMFFLGTSIVITAVNLHLMGVSLSRQSLASHGRAGLTRQWVPMAMLLGAAAVLAAAIALDWSRLGGLDDVREVLGELQRVGETMPAAAVLWPFRALVRLPLSPTPIEFLRGLPGAALVVFLNYRWVLRSDVAFEEASAAAAEKTAARLTRGTRTAAPRVRPVATPFTLALSGRPETAILWKNLILVGRYLSFRTLLRIVPAIIVVGVMVSRSVGSAGVAMAVSAISAWIAGFTILMGPQMARNDLRRDLMQLEVLKTWPIRGAALIRGEVAAPAVVLTTITWLCLLVAMAFTMGLPASQLEWTRRELVVAGITAALLAPGLILVQLVMHNMLAVVFPAWVVMGASRARGIEVMGQRMLLMFGLLLSLAIAVLPAGLAAALFGYAIYALTRSVPIILPAFIAAVVLVLECAIATEMLGGLLERTDISAVNVEE